MLEKIKVSVIMGVYNSDIKLLKKAIESILNQTHKNLEFIICNDSPNNLRLDECLREYSDKDSRIIILKNKKNCGLAYSLNQCLKKVSGKYIARQDDDDISKEQRLDKEIYFLEKNKQFSLVGTSISLIDKDGVWGRVINKKLPTKNDLLFGSIFTHPTIMVRAKAYFEVGGYSVEKWTRRTEDYDLFMKMYAAGMRGYNLPEQLYYYRLDKNYYDKQKFKYRLDEVKTKYYGFKNLGLYPKGYIYLLKPIISGMIPKRLKSILYRKRFDI